MSVTISGTGTITSSTGSLGFDNENLTTTGTLTGTLTSLPAISGASLTALNASNLASGTVGAARLGSGTASSSTFLRGDSTYAEIAASGWSHVETKIAANAAAAAGNAAMIFTHTVAAGFDYQFVFRDLNLGLDQSIATHVPSLQLGTGAGPTFQTSGYQNQTLITGATSVTAERDGLTAGITIHGNMGTQGGTDDTEFQTGSMTIFDPGSNKKTVTEGRMSIDDGNGVPLMNITNGRHNTAAVITAFRFNTANFHWETGTVALYRKAIA